MAIRNSPPNFRPVIPDPERIGSFSSGLRSTRMNEAGVTFNGSLTQLSRSTERRGWECEEATFQAAARLSGEAEDDMKHKKPWQNRSGHAVRALYCDVDHDGRQHWLLLGYRQDIMSQSPTYHDDAPYDEILENSGWGIVIPTTVEYGERWAAAVRGFMGPGR